MFDMIDYILVALIAAMLVANVAIEVKRVNDRKKEREIEAARVAAINKFNSNIVEFSKIVRALSPDVTELAAIKLTADSLIEQLLEHGDKMDQLLTKQEAVFTPMIHINSDVDPEELEKMIDETIKTGILTLPREETTVIYNKVPIDADIVEAFERRRDFYINETSHKDEWKRRFVADFERIDKWSSEYVALHKIQNFDTIVTLLSGHYYPVTKFGA